MARPKIDLARVFDFPYSDFPHVVFLKICLDHFFAISCFSGSRAIFISAMRQFMLFRIFSKRRDPRGPEKPYFQAMLVFFCIFSSLKTSFSNILG